ncbi:hypothetical protein [Hanstruepera marina]|uniref:hypothetical protein n=1 Tax=Hanstruepera marina TaxID=2873265 RepID=UPI001CA61D7D|nr:hypothetical protein [Hanstruepera marina]
MLYIKEKTLLKYALYCNAIYISLLFLFRPDGINLEKIFISSFLAFSVFGTFAICFRNIQLLKNLSKNTRRLFYLLMFWSTVVVFRSFSLSIQDWVTNFGNVYMALAWFTPILIVLGQKIDNWRIFFQAIFFMFSLMVISLFFLPFHLTAGKLKTEWSWLLRPINFVLLTGGIIGFKASIRFLIYITLLVYIIIAVLTEQRLEFIYLTMVLGLIFIDKLSQVKLRKDLLKLSFFSALVLTIAIFTYGYENLNNLIMSIVEFQDTRVFLYNELFENLNTFEKITGRGSLGTYYSYFMEHTKHYTVNVLNYEWWGDSSTRITIEVGYLQMILKGGLILFILTAYFMLKASYLGIFKSNNKFVKRLGLYIFIISVLSLISFRPAFTPTFILLWMAIGTVLNKKNRLMTDEEVNNLIKIN